MRKDPNLYPDTTEAKATSLYKALAKVVRKEDHAELARMLQLVLNSGTHFSRYSSNLTDAFVWRVTPQGYQYWWTLWKLVRDATH